MEGSDMAIVFTPIFFRERSSVTDIEREYAGRGAAADEKERGRGNEGNEGGRRSLVVKLFKYTSLHSSHTHTKNSNTLFFQKEMNGMKCFWVKSARRLQ